MHADGCAVDDRVAFDAVAGIPVYELAADLGSQLLAPLLGAMGTDLWYLLDQPVNAPLRTSRAA